MVISDIFSHLIELTTNVTDGFTTALFAADHEEKTLYLRNHMSLSSNFIPGVKIPFGQGPIGQVAETLKPVVLDHFDQETIRLEIYKKKEDLKSFIAVPVIHHELEGVLAVATKETYSFAPKMQKILSGFADQMAWHLYQEKLKPNRRGRAWPSIRKMNAYSQLLAECFDRNTVGERLIEIPQSILDHNAAAVLWFDSRGMGTIQHQRGFHQDLSMLEVNVGSGLAGACAQNRSPVLTKALHPPQTVLFSEQEAPENLGSVIAVPITMNQRLLGVLVCGSLRTDGLTLPDLDKLSLIAQAAASALYYAETKDRLLVDRNRDPITGVYNHRFLTDHQQAVSDKIFQEGQPVFFLTAQVANLPALYETHGVRHGDMLLKGMVSIFNKAIPSPKNIFKYSDNAFLIMVLKKDREQMAAIENKLKHLFSHQPLSVGGTPMTVKAEWGLSTYPDDGDHLLDLISLSWSRTSPNFKVTT